EGPVLVLDDCGNGGPRQAVPSRGDDPRLEPELAGSADHVLFRGELGASQMAACQLVWVRRNAQMPRDQADAQQPCVYCLWLDRRRAGPGPCHGMSLQAAVLSDVEMFGLRLECDWEGWGVEKRHAPKWNVYALVENRREIVELQYGDVEMEVTGEARDVLQRRIRRSEHQRDGDRTVVVEAQARHVRDRLVDGVGWLGRPRQQRGGEAEDAEVGLLFQAGAEAGVQRKNIERADMEYVGKAEGGKQQREQVDVGIDNWVARVDARDCAPCAGSGSVDVGPGKCHLNVVKRQALRQIAAVEAQQRRLLVDGKVCIRAEHGLARDLNFARGRCHGIQDEGERELPLRPVRADAAGPCAIGLVDFEGVGCLVVGRVEGDVERYVRGEATRVDVKVRLEARFEAEAAGEGRTFAEDNGP